MLVGDEAAQLVRLQRHDLTDGLRVRPCRQREEVAAIGVEGMGRHLPFDGEVTEELVDGNGRLRLPVIPSKAGSP